jgi:hypothetical protein
MDRFLKEVLNYMPTSPNTVFVARFVRPNPLGFTNTDHDGQKFRFASFLPIGRLVGGLLRRVRKRGYEIREICPRNITS